ncbi:MAG: hypothetical protein LBC89_00365 [Bacteroidales bacterium]|jgi:hypothetical protein|nr:hypothetical protein [Bacteroidales bacterium]
MRQRQPLSDKRLNTICTYCGDIADSRDHVPSKILLEEPFPDNLPLVPCCTKCNQNFSLDEEYFACLIECVLHGTADIKQLSRKRIKKILMRKELLRDRIKKSIIESSNQIIFKVENERMNNVLLKLAKGHIRYEYSELLFDEEPLFFNIQIAYNMSEKEWNYFIQPRHIDFMPEVGSRAMMELVVDSQNNILSHWQIVQPDIYSYMVSTNPITVKMFIWNLLAVEIHWDF